MQKITLIDDFTGRKENGENIKVFSRYSSELKIGFNEGYCVGDNYLPDNKNGDNLLKLWVTQAGYKSNEEAYKDEYYYYSEWYLMEDEAYSCFDNQGNEYEIIYN